MLKLGINNVSNSEYHADKEYLSSSNLKTLLKDPQQFYDEKILGLKKSSVGSHFDEGSLTHSYILEPAAVAREYAFFSGLRKQGAEYEKFKEANPDKMIISRPQALRVENYVKAYNRNPVAQELINSGGEPEHTMCTLLSEVPVKARADWINIERGYIADVKTTGMPADVDSFRLTISNWSYDLSAALYAAVASEIYGKPFEFYFIVVEKNNLVCDVYKASKATMDKGLKQVAAALKLYKQCKETGIWKLDQPEKVDNKYEIIEV